MLFVDGLFLVSDIQYGMPYLQPEKSKRSCLRPVPSLQQMTLKLSESEAQPLYRLVSAKVKNGKKQLLVQDSRRATGDPGTEDESKSEREIKTASTSIKPSTSQTLLEEKSGL